MVPRVYDASFTISTSISLAKHVQMYVLLSENYFCYFWITFQVRSLFSYYLVKYSITCFRLNYCIHNQDMLKLMRMIYGKRSLRPFKMPSVMQSWTQMIYLVWAYQRKEAHLLHGIEQPVRHSTILLRGKIYEPIQWFENGMIALRSRYTN